MVVALIPSALHAAASEDKPLTLAVSNVGDFAKGYSWYLSVNSAGQAELTIDAPGRLVRRRFDIPNEEISLLRKVIAEEDFFGLADKYGQVVPDGSTQTLTITVGERAKSVTIQFLMNWVTAKDKQKLGDPSRAVRLLVMIRGWFEHPEAVDLRKYDRMVLNTVK